MQKVESGKFVSVSYTGTLENGEPFDSNEGRPPLEFKVGAGQMIKGFEAAVMGMELNEKKTVTLPPEDAYGQRDDAQMHEFPKAQIPPGIDPQVGQTLALTSPQGQQIPARVAAVDDEKITFDLNHPLAGKTLIFGIEVVAISDTPTQQPAGCASGCDCSSGCGSSGCGC
jgi:peptidylprolyl isomerase